MGRRRTADFATLLGLLGAQVTWYGDDALQLRAGYMLGTEPDYTTHAVSLRASRDLGE